MSAWLLWVQAESLHARDAERWSPRQTARVAVVGAGYGRATSDSRFPPPASASSVEYVNPRNTDASDSPGKPSPQGPAGSASLPWPCILTLSDPLPSRPTGRATFFSLLSLADETETGSGEHRVRCLAVLQSRLSRSLELDPPLFCSRPSTI